MKIKELEINDRARVTGYSESAGSYRQKLLAMGLLRGVEFTVIRKAPLGDPVEIRMASFNLSLRGAEADALEVERV